MIWVRKNLDLIFSIVLTLIFIYPLYFTDLLNKTFIFNKEIFISVYLAIIIGVFTIFALFSTFVKVIGHFKNKQRESILNTSFKYPIISSLIGIIIVFISTFIYYKFLILLNLFFFFYSSLSVVALFLTIYEIISIISTK